MLQPRTPVKQYAQAGYAKFGVNAPAEASGVHIFAEYTRQCAPDNCGTGSKIVRRVVPAPSNGYTTYRVVLRADDDRIHMGHNATNILTMARDVTGEWHPDWRGDFAGETWHSTSDVPGTDSNRTAFNNIEFYNSSGGINFIQQLNAYACPDSDPGCEEFGYFRYDQAIGDAQVGGKYVRIWTDPL
jgi:hypothetical protein